MNNSFWPKCHFEHYSTEATRCVGAVPLRLYRLLLKHWIYVSVTKPTCSAFGDWLNIDSACFSKVTGIAVKPCSMTLSSMICAALNGRSIVGSNCDSKNCRYFDLSVLVGMHSGIDSGHGTGSRGSDDVNSRSKLCSIERTSWPKTFLSSGWISFANWSIFHWPHKPHNVFGCCI